MITNITDFFVIICKYGNKTCIKSYFIFWKFKMKKYMTGTKNVFMLNV